MTADCDYYIKHILHKTYYICYIKGQCNGNSSFIGYPNKYFPYLFTFRREILRVIYIQVTIIQYLSKGFEVKFTVRTPIKDSKQNLFLRKCVYKINVNLVLVSKNILFFIKLMSWFYKKKLI